MENVNRITGPKKSVGLDNLFTDTNFVVYSADQIEAQSTKQIVEEMFDSTSATNFHGSIARTVD